MRYLNALAEFIMGLMELVTSFRPSLLGPVAKGSGELEAKRWKI